MLAMVLSLPCRSQFFEDFSDGDFLNNPTWTGDTGQFRIDSNLTLQSQGNPKSQTIFLSVSSSRIKNQIWEFFVRCDFSPSSGNHARIYLAASDTGDNPEGYFVRLGGISGSDDAVDLYRSHHGDHEKLIEGLPGFFGKPSNLALIRVKRDYHGRWELEVDTTATGQNFIFQGYTFDTTMVSSQYFSCNFKHTSTRRDLFFFDDLLIRNGDMDLVSAKSRGEKEIEVCFSSGLDPNKNLPVENFSIGNPARIPDSVVLIPGKSNSLRLTFSNALEQGPAWVRVNQIQDEEGNLLESDSVEIIVNRGKPRPEEIIINEIFYDPVPQVGLPEYEFLELHNPTEAFLSLEGLRIRINGRSSSLPSEIIWPGEHIILCSPEAAEEYKYLGRSLGLEDFPPLVNSGASISLIGRDSSILDRTFYSSVLFSDAEKRNGGYSLELKDPGRPCGGLLNWDGSNSSTGGTPGKINSIYNTEPDSGSNYITKINPISTGFIQVDFAKGLEKSSLDRHKYKISNETLVHTLSWLDTLRLNSVLLELRPALIPGSTYFLSADSLKDCDENIFSIPVQRFGIGKRPGLGDIVLTEYLPIESENGFSDEYLELFNAGDSIINLAGVKISDLTGDVSLPERNLFPGDYLLLSASNPHPNLLNWLDIGIPSINNSGDMILLKDQDKRILQRINFNPELFNEVKLEGRSIELIHPNAFCEKKKNWKVSTYGAGGTPGKQNSVFDPHFQEKRPKITEAYFDQDSNLIINLSKRVDTLKSISNGKIEFGSGQVFDPIFSKTDGSFSRMVLPSGLVDQNDNDLQLKNFYSCAGTRFSTPSGALLKPETPKPGTLILNEILFDHKTGSAEFLELLVRGEVPILTDGIWLIYSTDTEKPGDSIRLQFPGPLLFPEDFLVLTKDSTSVRNAFPRTPPKTLIQENSLPGLNDDQGILELRYTDSLMVDKAIYDEEMHFALLDQTENVSLEKIIPENSGLDQNNWASASSGSGYGTPGLPNSQYVGNSGAEELVSVHPAIFSPDGDGYQDILEIRVNSGGIQALISIEVYTANGNRFRNVAHQQVLGNRNVFLWDGFSDQNQKASFGNYIVLVSIFEPGQKTKRVKRIVGVGGYVK